MKSSSSLFVLFCALGACSSSKDVVYDDSVVSTDDSGGDSGLDDSGADDSADDSGDDSGDPSACAGEAARLGDRPYTTIQAAIDAAGAGDVVEICPGTWSENLVVPVNIGGDLELRGIEGRAATAIDGGGAGTVLEVQAGHTLRLSGLTLRGGAGLDVEGVLSGGGLYCVGGEVVVDEVAVRENTADIGGGVYLRGCSITGIDGVISENFSRNGAGVYVDRDDDHPVALEDLEFVGNEASASGGGLYVEGRSRNSFDVVVERCVFTENRGYDGAGIYEGTRHASLQIVDSSLLSNDGKQGGAVYVDSGMTMSNVILSDNGTEKEGGALWLDDDSVTVVDSSVFKLNYGTGGAAAWAPGVFDFTCTDCDFSTPPNDNFPEDIGSETFSVNYGDGVDITCDASGCTGG